MLLFHFTSRYHAPSCLIHGLRYGCMPITLSPPRVKQGYQWLTFNSDWEQSWTESTTLLYDRTAVRFAIEIPRKARRKVFRWIERGTDLTNRKMFDTLNAYGDPENWYVFKGEIPVSWISEVTMKPAALGQGVLAGYGESCDARR